MGCKLLVKVETFHIGVTWSLGISEADRSIQTTVQRVIVGNGAPKSTKIFGINQIIFANLPQIRQN